MPATWSTDDQLKLLISMLLATTARPLNANEWANTARKVTSMGKSVSNEACRQHYARLRRQYESQLSQSGAQTIEEAGDTSTKNSPVKRKQSFKSSDQQDNNVKRRKNKDAHATEQEHNPNGARKIKRESQLPQLGIDTYLDDDDIAV